ncbi:similar to Saccharomyces cerevisiae YPR021C AGC1 Mitochondrial amino acid transporter, acts both as a glutamate uniporter and as an aspartate- glutamate exchanger [Maudiozyma barnettii]|uniref:Mitochondrial aspartate-glutamate transporter AGC1 n=1 Tax=Maudiozyma barnettii TaxID=61262 RepID=A0A8H2VEY5_9SACH|nr:citrin [Kazachstania barnettii]CAB4254359.1 similar to Saccharomyces cerevisiae YPR021C AGC1 Mitochondrial amino acid transporter, acts both as a glutamate uniporter and as an aspartate- glutamate exchanger [Kazachstania barnettii]CAD1782229.1 similar to Saccharomyces cerevisiae YPR021C AGC1 Mitochondrial amino acid transporter, acts both as a glutamate uniporter and as an aspartate- glutamate exchanger [Kazachstania barnettii]
MEQINSNSRKKLQQLDIFKKYAAESKDGNGELVLSYDEFIELISNSQRLYSTLTDHSFNLNHVPTNTFGCIFFAIDEHNKGYLTINDWFYFNNILECNDYNLILLYEFFRKFDIEQLKHGIIENSGTQIDTHRMKTINYSDRFLDFNDLLLNVSQFKKTIGLLQDSMKNNTISLKGSGLLFDWDNLPLWKLYETFPYGGISQMNNNQNAFISLNSLMTMLQTDLKNDRLKQGFDQLSQLDSRQNCLTITRNQLIQLLKGLYSHKVSYDIFDSLVDITPQGSLKRDDQTIPYGVFRDVTYLFENFDLLNEVLLKHASGNGLSASDLREYTIDKETLMDLLNTQYNKVNNLTRFSPTQIDLLFKIISNSKKLHRRKLTSHDENNDQKMEHFHEDSQINDFIRTEYMYGTNEKPKTELELFNDNYIDQSNEFCQDISEYMDIPGHRKSLFKQIFGSSNVISDFDIDDDSLTIEDFTKIINPNYLNDIIHILELQNVKNSSLYVNYYFYPIFDSIYNFCLGSIAGCIGATVVYPIDFIKTRMQAQRSNAKYKNSIDCLLKVVKAEGIRGLYSGLGFQLIGVAPEKAIKLTVNDFMRKRLVGNQNQLSVSGEVLSGASAGMCQVIFTNPIEIVKIRLQVKSEYVGSADTTAIQIIRRLGLSGLYKGVAACLMRDVPFSAIYFPTYAHLKKDLFQFDPNDKTKRNRLKTWELLLAGGLAGMPAAFLTTPFDVAKTRLQIEPKQGETSYNGIFHAFKTILKEESFRSFFKGGGARVLRSSPQFGFTLAAYELFKNSFPVPNFGSDSKTSPGGSTDIGSSVASLAIFSQQAKNNSKKFAYNSSMELYGPTIDPYSSNYLNYYYKSCEVAKTFIDLDNNFARFDKSVYSRFNDYLKSIGSAR